MHPVRHPFEMLSAEFLRCVRVATADQEARSKDPCPSGFQVPISEWPETGQVSDKPLGKSTNRSINPALFARSIRRAARVVSAPACSQHVRLRSRDWSGPWSLELRVLRIASRAYNLRNGSALAKIRTFGSKLPSWVLTLAKASMRGLGGSKGADESHRDIDASFGC